MFIIIVVWLGRRDFWFSCPFKFFPDSCLSCCSDARVFGRALVHEFPISCTHTEWHLRFQRNDRIEMVEESPVKN